jgi:tetratricopeptide (TPR) repeat protein
MADSWMLLSLYGNITPMKAAEKAQPMIEKALAIEPESAEAFAALGLTRWQIGQYDSAESALRRAMELNQDYIPAQLWLAGVLAELGRYPEESSILEQAMRLDPLNELLVINYSESQRIRGDFGAARQMLRKLIDLRPDSTMLLRSLAAQELAQGELVEGWKLAHRAWLLEPDNPADIAVLAKTWIALGNLDEAEKLLLAGLEQASQNFNLLDSYWLSLLITGRFEEAEGLVHEMMEDAGEDPPTAMQQMFNQYLGMIALARKDLPAAAQFLDTVLSEKENNGYDTNEILTLTLAALVSKQLGQEDKAASQLAMAERKLARARLNGVNDPDIYYAEATILVMRSDVPAALDKLQLAYEHGFRNLWLLNLDWRWESIRDEPLFVDLRARMRRDIDGALAEIRSLILAAL